MTSSYSTSYSARSSARPDLALLVLRVVVGLVFLAHGWQKVFVFGHAGVTGMLTGMHVPLPAVAAAGLMALELLGGVALIVGAFTRVVALLFAADMLGAIVLAKLSGGFFAPKGYEYELTLLAASLALALGGAGAASVDRAIAERRRSAR
jgi:putative oxidoreductase